MNTIDRALHRLQRALVLGAPNRRTTPRPAPDTPGAPRTTGITATIVGHTIAALLSIGVAAALIPLRDDLSQSISLLMVIPVLLVALLAGAPHATTAALAAAAAFDFFHTEPYYHPTINDADDIVETVTLLIIGIVAGYLAQSAQRALVAARVRRQELAAVTSFLDQLGTDIDPGDLADHARHSIEHVLNAISCDWLPDYQGTASPVLNPDGTIFYDAAIHRAPDGGQLPTTIEIPIRTTPGPGRFIVRTRRNTIVSTEEREAAATIASALGRHIPR